MDHPVRQWRRTAVVAVVLLVLAGVLIAVAYTGGLTGEDVSALTGAAETRTGALNTAVVVLTEIGNTAASAVLAVVVGGVLWWRGRRGDAVYLIATMATASLVFTIIKRILDRPRPPADLRVIEASNESLPSGHATMSAVVLASIVIVFWPQLAALGRTVLTAVAVLWPAAIGATRIYLGVHWFSDVLAGWALGLGWAFLGAAILFRWRARTPAAPESAAAP
ncbi:MAG: phosphatase PAP2 family protein [Pseudonocardia sediminis]